MHIYDFAIGYSILDLFRMLGILLVIDFLKYNLFSWNTRKWSSIKWGSRCQNFSVQCRVLYIVVCLFSFGHCIALSSSFGHCIALSSSFGHCIALSSSFGHYSVTVQENLSFIIY